MTLRLSVRIFFIFTLGITLIALQGGSLARAEEGSYRIEGVVAEKRGENLVLRITGSSQPTYTVYELFDPLRVVIDIADAFFSEAVRLPLAFSSGPLATVNGRIETEKKPPLARLEFFLAAEHKYSVERSGDDIVATFLPEVVAPAPSANAGGSGSGPAVSPESAIVADLLRQHQEEGSAEPPTDASAQPRDFAYSGYNKMGISVDFYKIDLHNVFRLFGEISGMNIVVAEGVGGTLTLALNNVPWDFALDVILNLKDLQKVERFGTIVISPKSKQFDWPQQAVDNLAVRPGGTSPLTVTAKPAGDGSSGAAGQVDGRDQNVTVEQKDQIPEQALASKKIVTEGRGLEKAGNIDGALALYEKAFSTWPEDGDLAKRIASLYLVRKAMHSKAAYYGRAALGLDPVDRDAALIAAIAEANMKKIGEAKELFDLAIREGGENTAPPASEALMSYAFFNEENGNNMGAVLLLDRHEQLYGDTLETLVAKARIHDKEGNSSKAAAVYESILLSGFELPADLIRYINGRIALQNQGQQIR